MRLCQLGRGAATARAGTGGGAQPEQPTICPHARTQVEIAYRPVHSEPLDKEMPYVPPKARTY